MRQWRQNLQLQQSMMSKYGGSWQLDTLLKKIGTLLCICAAALTTKKGKWNKKVKNTYAHRLKAGSVALMKKSLRKGLNTWGISLHMVLILFSTIYCTCKHVELAIIRVQGIVGSQREYFRNSRYATGYKKLQSSKQHKRNIYTVYLSSVAQDSDQRLRDQS